MDVLMVSNMFPTEDDPGRGAFVADQVEDLRDAGVGVRLFTFDARGRRRAYAEAALEVHRVFRRRPFDLIHVQYGLSGLATAFTWNTHVVTTFHGSDVNSPWQRRCSRPLARRGAVITQSRRDATALALPSTYVIPCGIDDTVFSPEPRQASRVKLGWASGPTVLLPGSRSRRVKGALLFDAAVDFAERSIGRKLNRASLEGVTRAEAAAAFNAADVVLVTSDWEGGPMVVKEALACMTPVVSVDVGDVREVIGDLDGCHVADRSPVALGEALASALTSVRRDAWRHRATEYTRRAMSDRILRVYEQQLGSDCRTLTPTSAARERT